MIGPGDCCCDGLDCDVMLPEAAEILTAEWSLRFTGVESLLGTVNSCSVFSGVWGNGSSPYRPALDFWIETDDYVQYRADAAGPDIPGDSCFEVSPPPIVGIILWIAKEPGGVAFLNGLMDTLVPGCRDRDIYAMISMGGVGGEDATGGHASVYFCTGNSDGSWTPCNQGGHACCTDSEAGLSEVRRIV